MVARLPVRLVRDRVRYEDLAHQTYAPPNPGIHHRNETLTGLADPQLLFQAGGHAGDWSIGGAAGVSVPLGRTEPNPFALGRLGLAHEHTQFGTGTWDPMLEAGIGRPFGPIDVRLTGITRLPVATNEHGFRAGRRHALILNASHRASRSWSLSADMILNREEAETWDGRVEEEGNLGRTDLLMGLGVTRVTTSLGALQASVHFPIHSHVREHQTDIPVIARVTWTP